MLQIAVSITSFISLLGLIMYIIFKVQESSSKLSLTEDHIMALKDDGIIIDDPNNMSKENLELILKSKDQVNEKLINTVLKKEINNKSRIALIVTIICFLLAAFFGILAYLVNKEGSEMRKGNYFPNESTKKEIIQQVKLDNIIKQDNEAKELVTNKYITDVKEKIDTITITSIPNNIDIYLDNKYYGKTDQTLYIPSKQYMIKVKTNNKVDSQLYDPKQKRTIFTFNLYK